MWFPEDLENTPFTLSTIPYEIDFASQFWKENVLEKLIFWGQDDVISYLDKDKLIDDNDEKTI